MSKPRKCKWSGKWYTENNLPVGRLAGVATNTNSYIIRAEHHDKPKDVWYQGIFLGDRYAVFEPIFDNKCNVIGYHQLTRYYDRFGMAVNRMLKLAREE